MRVYFILFVLMCSIVVTQENPDPPEAVTKVATSAANWLKIESGVRGISMGGSQVACGTGVSGCFIILPVLPLLRPLRYIIPNLII